MNKTESTVVPCGLEVSYKTLVVDRAGGPAREFPNTPAGHRSLVAWLRRGPQPVRVCLEATGLYGLDVALQLDHAGMAVMVANPRAVRSFAQALLKRSKTDQLDAAVLREFAARMPFRAWVRPSDAALKLTAVSRRIQALTKMIAAEKNRLHAASVSSALPSLVRNDIVRSIRNLEQAIDRLRRAAMLLILEDQAMARQHKLLVSIPGVGVTSAIHVLAELQMLSSDADVRQWVAHAGLDPRHHTSGSSVAKKPMISRSGNARLRRALYMPALVAVQHEPHFQGFYLRLVARGKTKMQALVAVMRKLLHAIYGMFHHDQAFDGEKVYILKPELERKCA
jgi:transposase